MAFDSLQERLSKSLRNLQGKGKLTEKNMEDTLQEIRVALLEADVNYQVATSFLKQVRFKVTGQDVLNTVDPGEQLVKIVNDEIIALLGDRDNSLNLKNSGLTVIMVVGLQGTGKTTQVAKIANLLKKQGRNVLMAACDLVRPAAVEQLETLGQQIGVEVFKRDLSLGALQVSKEAVSYAKDHDFDTLLIDTAGRLQIDQVLMQELKDIKEAVKPDEILLTVDALTGQDICNVATSFHEQLQVSGLIVTKFDGDSKGGSILSVKAVTGVPVKFTGVGERIGDIEPFYPDRVAQRILGMGDIVSLVEKAQQEMDAKKATDVAKRMSEGKYTLDDMLISIEQSSKLGPISSIISMLPGLSGLKNQINDAEAEASLKKTKAIIQSMTAVEREDPTRLRGSHKRRIAAGSGTTVDDVNRLINQYEKTKKVVKQMSSMKGLFR